MKRFFSYFLFFLIIQILMPLNMMAEEENTISLKEEELKNRLKGKLSEKERLHTLYDLSKCYRDEPAERDYSILLYKQALKLDSTSMMKNAIFTLTRYYYNRNIKDSVEFWSDKIRILEEKNQRHSDQFYKICNMACQFVLWDSPNEVTANEALRLYHLAFKEKNKIGIYSSCETLGVAYSSMGQDSLAVKYYLEAIDKLKSAERSNYSNFHSLLELTVASMLRMNSGKMTEEFIAKYERLTEKINDGKYFTNKYPIERCRWLASSFRVRYYVQNGELNKALHYYLISKSYLNNVDDIYARYYFYLVATYYFKARKDYKLALYNMDEVLKLGWSTELYMLKGELLSLNGKYKEANECYLSAISESKKESNENFMRQMNQLSHMQDINNVTQAQNEEILKRKQWQIVFILCITCFTGILLLISVIYTVHNRHTKNMLKQDRDKLLESEKDLKIAKEKAVEADHLKSLFLANMSHEIRTPLNAIVGFSQILCDTNYSMTDADRHQFSSLILHNSDLLLNLINDILDISKLESNVYKFEYADDDIELCCSDCIESVRHLVGDGVNLSYISHSEPFMLHTDILRLRQVIMNLLTNASKFTKQGSITLEYSVDYDQGMVQFSVTDTGCGIPEDKQKIIFNRFEKLDNYVQGTGLGLAISALIVKQFGGKIWVDSSYTNGSRFVFTHKI